METHAHYRYGGVAACVRNPVHTDHSLNLSSLPLVPLHPVPLSPQSQQCPEYIKFGKVGHHDEIKLQTLLRAARVDLDSAADVTSNEGSPWRKTGLVLMVNINYENRHLMYTPSDVSYTVTVTALSGTGFSATEVLHNDPNSVKRIVALRTGIRIILAQTADFGTFSFAKVISYHTRVSLKYTWLILICASHVVY